MKSLITLFCLVSINCFAVGGLGGGTISPVLGQGGGGGGSGTATNFIGTNGVVVNSAVSNVVVTAGVTTNIAFVEGPNNATLHLSIDGLAPSFKSVTVTNDSTFQRGLTVKHALSVVPTSADNTIMAAGTNATMILGFYSPGANTLLSIVDTNGNWNATNITGTLPDARLSGNVALLSSTSVQSFTNGVNLASSGGNVGIGTGSPISKLDIENAGGLLVKVVNNATSGNADVELKNSLADWYFGTAITASSIFEIYDASQGADRFVIAGTTGYIGIGTNAPSQALEVSGNGKFSGSVTANGFVANGATGITTNWPINALNKLVISNGIVVGIQ